MMDRIKKMKADVIVSALLSAALGIVLLIWPAETIDAVCKVLAIGLIIIGVVNLVTFFLDRKAHPFAGVLGAIVALVGVWIFARPDSIVSIVPIVIGVMLCVHGLQDVKLALEAKSNEYEKWWSMLLLALVSLVLGALCISNAFGIVTLAMQFIGVALLFDGLTDLWIATRTIRAAREMRKREEALDVEYKEVKETEEEQNPKEQENTEIVGEPEQVDEES